MKFEKRDSGETTAAVPEEETPSTGGNKPVVVYIMILFIAAFLLMALSFFMHQRSNTEALGELQNSVSAMQEVQANQEKIIALQEELAEAEETLNQQKESYEKELLQAQLENQALLALYTLQQQYSAEDYTACQQTIDEFLAAGYETLLPKKSENGVTSPAVRFQQLQEAVEKKLRAVAPEQD